MMRITLLFFLLTAQFAVGQQRLSTIKGKISADDGSTLPAANIQIEGTALGTSSDESGVFEIRQLQKGSYKLKASLIGYQSLSKVVQVGENETVELNFTLRSSTTELSGVEVFGERDKQPEKLDAVTRLPLKPSDQIQSISVISDRLIELQGNLTISEAARNVPGVYTFATYGNQRESMSSRGFRGIPMLKNGVRINSDFRGIGMITDMQGVESLQVLKGSSAITQGIATDIGSPGGVINIVTKTPKFEQGGQASLRVGSWGQFRPSFDVYGPLDEAKTVAFRVNGVYENTGSYRPAISYEKVYINPTMEWRPNDRTSVTLELDHLQDSRTPDPGTVNLSENDIEAIYDIPYDRFVGFETNRVITRNTTYTARFTRKLNDHLNLRAAYFRSNLDVDGVTTSLSSGSAANENGYYFSNNREMRGLPRLTELNKRYRTIGGSGRIDNNSVLQFDLVGQDVHTGTIKHTFQVGFDFRTTYVETSSSSLASLTYVDIIDIFQPISNKLPGSGVLFVPAVKDAQGNITQPATTTAANLSLTAGNPVTSRTAAYGVMAQDVISVTDWAKVILGIRYSSSESTGSAVDTKITRGDAFNPQLGVMLTPLKGLNLFGSYTSSTSLGSASNVDVNGNELGDQRIDQVEAGIKSDWVNNRLRFNLTLYKINNKNMALPVYDENWNATGYYVKGGNDERKGVEVEIIGRLLSNLEIVGGYAFIDAQYKEHTSYYRGSAPLNTPKHTANFWLNYIVSTGTLQGLSFGAGAYYISERPVNDWATSVTHEGIVPGQKPFDIGAYTIVNAQLGYNYDKYAIRLLFNNIFDEIGYNAYRTSFINQIDPRNFACVVSYKF